MKRKNAWIPIAASAAVIGLLGVILQARSGQELENKKSSVQAPRASVRGMRDSPLKLGIPHPEITGEDLYAPQVDVVIENTSSKDVSSYAIRYDLGFNGELRPGGVELNQSSIARSILRQGDSRTLTVGDAHYSLPLERVVVSLDFVEFTDGSTWGADKYSSKELLAGLRAGAHAMTEHLLRALTESPNALSAELTDTEDHIDGGEQSPKWLEGFQRGKAFIKERAKHEIRTFSVVEARKALALPIDALDEINRR